MTGLPPGAPLADVRVVATEEYGAGPFGTMQLADLGAERIRFEDLEPVHPRIVCVSLSGFGTTGPRAGPGQVAGLHIGFAPTKEEVERARRVLAPWEEIVAGGGAVGVVDGMLVDLPVVERARVVIESSEGSDPR